MAQQQCSSSNIHKRRKQLCHSISEALASKSWSDAASLLLDLSQDPSTTTKLGSLQRWVRDADGARFEDEPMSLSLLWLLCRVSSQRCAQRRPSSVTLRETVVWEPTARETSEDDSHESALLEMLRSSVKIVHREKAALRQPPNHFDLKIWGSFEPLPFLDSSPQKEPCRVDFPAVKGVFVVKDVLSRKECRRLLVAAETLGFERDLPLSLDEKLEAQRLPSAGAFGCLGSDSEDDDEEEKKEGDEPVPGISLQSRACVWCVDDSLNEALFERCAKHLPQTWSDCSDAKGKAVGEGTLAGLNRRYRFYRYDPGGTYRPHVDGAWPASGLEKKKYVYDAYGDRLSKLTCLIYLNDDFNGGNTAFYTAADDESLRVDGVQPRAGSVLFFPHGCASGSLLHEGSTVTEGSKFVIRTEVLYKWERRTEKTLS